MVAVATNENVQDINRELGFLRNKEINKSKLIIARGESVKIELGFPDESEMYERLRYKYNSRKRARLIMMFQRLYEIHFNEEEFQEDNADALRFLRNVRNYYNKDEVRFTEEHSAIDIVAELLQKDIEKVAKSFAREYAKKGIQLEEFKAEFNEEVVRLMNQPPSDPNYSFYESLNQSYLKRAVDVVRREWGDEEKNKQRKHERCAKSIEQLKAKGMLDVAESRLVDRDPTAEQVEMKILLEQIFSLLNEQEREIMQLMYTCGGNASNREIGESLGINYKKVERIKRKIKQKASEEFGSLGDIL